MIVSISCGGECNATDEDSLESAPTPACSFRPFRKGINVDTNILYTMSFDSDFLNLNDLCTAYRKAKAEAFRDTNCAHGQKFAKFEEHLEFNLRLLLQKLTAKKPSWFRDARLLGRATCITKAVTPQGPDESHFQLTNPLHDWKRIHTNEKARADFRPVVDASVDFQIISALWIMKVGHVYDACLDSRFAVGNRLRRWRAPENSPPGSAGPLNEQSHALFQPYFLAYGGWREGGLKAMTEELKAGKHIVAVTMDLKRFYHQVDPSFLLHPAYLSATDIVLEKDQRKFTEQFITAIVSWNKIAEKLTGKKQYGIPVGLTASRIIANVVLKEFDSGIQNLRPSYYGRYVDDIFLVLTHSGFGDSNELMRYLERKLGKIARYSEGRESDDGPALHLHFPYGGNSELLFVGKKQKVFQLEGQHGLDLINPIEEQIRRQKSEHQELPDLPDQESEMAARALLVSSDATLDADALRKADAVTLRRAGFAMLLSAVEQHAHHVESKTWKDVRRRFYGLAERHLLTPRGFFDFERYIPRVLGVMVACRDHQRALSYVRSLANLLKLLRQTCEYRPAEFTACVRTLAERMIEAVLQSPPVERKRASVLTLITQIVRRMAPTLRVPRREEKIRHVAEKLFLADWSRRPYGSTWIESHVSETAAISRPRDPVIHNFIKFGTLKKLQRIASIDQPFHWPALAFPTRPITIPELTAYAPALLYDYEVLTEIISALRGTWSAIASGLRVSDESATTPGKVFIPVPERRPLRIAVTNFLTSYKEWSAAVKGRPVHSLTRYRRFNRFINELLRTSPRPSYVLLPECSLPRRWSRSIASKLSQKGISLIAGLEYVRGTTGLRNEALIWLNSDFAGYAANVAILQPKLAPAWGEQKEIEKLVGLTLETPSSAAFKLPVYVHGKFCFGVLICSDLTTIRNRSALQGHIDCLFVPEWNQDLETFVALVEASTHDLHAYVVQANNRLYGDSRIRAPYKQSFKRDVVRVRGGLHDYFVTDKIDIDALRDFQSQSTPPDGDDVLFKPFPIGYKSARIRSRK